MDWFVATISEVRRHLGGASFGIYSDGRPEELGRLLSLPGVSWASRGSAIVDMLAMSRSSLLIASGASTYSAWAAYLGLVPSLTSDHRTFHSLGLDAVPRLRGRIASTGSPERSPTIESWLRDS